MKGVRFYEEFENKNRKGEKSKGNVIAARIKTSYYDLLIPGETFECLAAVLAGNKPNSPVCFTPVSWKYLRENCKRISEARAREIHPKLFERLDS